MAGGLPREPEITLQKTALLRSGNLFLIKMQPANTESKSSAYFHGGILKYSGPYNIHYLIPELILMSRILLLCLLLQYPIAVWRWLI